MGLQLKTPLEIIHANLPLIDTADQDSVRLLAVDSCGPLARLLTRDESAAHVLPVVQKFASVSMSDLPSYARIL